MTTRQEARIKKEARAYTRGVVIPGLKQEINRLMKAGIIDVNKFSDGDLARAFIYVALKNQIYQVPLSKQIKYLIYKLIKL